MHKRSIAIAAIAALSASSASAQEIADAPTPPAENSAIDESGRNPAVTYLMQVYKISEAEAAERIALQEEIGRLAESLEGSGDPAFSSISIQHEPVFKIVISFADNADRTALVRTIDPKLRRYVQIKQVKRSKSSWKGGLQQLEASLNVEKSWIREREKHLSS